jgi:hypothetical protein
MPIKFGGIENVQLFVGQDGEYKPLGHITDVEITSEPGTALNEYTKRLMTLQAESVEFTFNLKGKQKAFWIFITTGNDLYLRFPKKLRRKK